MTRKGPLDSDGKKPSVVRAPSSRGWEEPGPCPIVSYKSNRPSTISSVPSAFLLLLTLVFHLPRNRIQRHFEASGAERSPCVSSPPGCSPSSFPASRRGAQRRRTQWWFLPCPFSCDFALVLLAGREGKCVAQSVTDWGRQKVVQGLGRKKPSAHNPCDAWLCGSPVALATHCLPCVSATLETPWELGPPASPFPPGLVSGTEGWTSMSCGLVPL